MRSHFVLAVLIAVPLPALAEPGLHDFKSVAIAPDGRDHVGACNGQCHTQLQLRHYLSHHARR
jgi:hypothetical protein